MYEIEFTVSVIFADCDSEASNDEIEAVELSDGDKPEGEESEEEHLMLRRRLPQSARRPKQPPQTLAVTAPLGRGNALSLPAAPRPLQLSRVAVATQKRSRFGSRR